MAASPRFEEFWLSRFERPRTVSPRGPGASPRCAPGASQYGACCSSMDDSATIEASKLYPGRVVDSAIARKERLATHVPSRPAHLEDPETRRLQENEIKAQFYQSTLKPKGTFGGSSWVPMPSSLSTYTAYVHSESPRGQDFSMHTEALDEHTRFWKSHRSVVNPNSMDAASCVPSSFNFYVAPKPDFGRASSPRNSPRNSPREHEPSRLRLDGKLKPWLR